MSEWTVRLDSKPAKKNKTSVILADNLPLMRDAIRIWLEKQQDLEVVAEAGDGKILVEVAEKLYPDIVLLSIDLPIINGIEACKRITQMCRNTRILVLTIENDITLIEKLMEIGIHGYVSKNVPGEVLVYAVRRILMGENLYPHLMVEKEFSSRKTEVDLKLTSEPQDLLTNLTSREISVLKLVAKGLPNKEIAANLGLSVPYVKGILTVLFSKLGVASRTEAISLGLNTGLINTEDFSKIQN